MPLAGLQSAHMYDECPRCKTRLRGIRRKGKLFARNAVRSYTPLVLSTSVVDIAAVLKEASATALNYAGAHQQDGHACHALAAIKRYGTDPIGGRTSVTRADVCPASYVSV
jgi:hypothetical protein